MNTAFLLMAQYEGKAIIPVASVVRDYFPHLTTDKFVRKVALANATAIVVSDWVAREKGLQQVNQDVDTLDLFGGAA